MSDILGLYKDLKRNTKDLRQIEETIKTVKTLPYYSIFGNVQEKSKDLNTAEEAKKACLNERHVILENIALAVRKELNLVSQQQQFKVA